jgi:hypothetical protein
MKKKLTIIASDDDGYDKQVSSKVNEKVKKMMTPKSHFKQLDMKSYTGPRTIEEVMNKYNTKEFDDAQVGSLELKDKRNEEYKAYLYYYN